MNGNGGHAQDAGKSGLTARDFAGLRQRFVSLFFFHAALLGDA
ncbi:hypothetical protein L505_3669 [Bordetella bronchiseptica F4563]|nr:hypothetical protein L505_3669 [Bordetella bronchiseptica F4563]